MTYAEIMKLEAIADDLTAVSKYLESLTNSPTLKQCGVDVTTIPGYAKRLQRTAEELLQMRVDGVQGIQEEMVL